MKQHFKFMILIIFVITILLKPLNVEASSTALPINPGISPSIVSQSEFMTWLLSLYGIRSNNTRLIDNTNFMELVEREIQNGNYDINIDELKNELYTGYVYSPYKVTIPRSKFIKLGQILGSIFSLANGVNVQVMVPDGEGTFNADYTINVLNNEFGESYNNVQSYTPVFNEIFTNYSNRIESIHAFKYSIGEPYIVTNIIFCLDYDWTIENNVAHFQSDWILFSCTTRGVDTVGYGMANKSDIDTLDLPQDGIIEIGKSNFMDGTVSINPDFTQQLINGAYSLITPYTMDITSEDVVIPVPKDIPTILENVSTGEISTTQAIEEAQSVPVDTTDTQAIAQAQTLVFSPSPEFQTYGLGDIFPFCIPFDIYHILISFVDPPKTPEFDIQLPDGGHDREGNITFYTQHVSFEQFDNIASLARTLELVIFGIGLAVITRSFIMRA